MLTCLNCSTSFDNATSHQNHVRGCGDVKTVIFKETGQKFTVEKNSNGKYSCYCSAPTCPKGQGFSSVQTLKNHMKKAGTEWIGKQGKLQGNQASKSPAQTPSRLQREEPEEEEGNRQESQAQDQGQQEQGTQSQAQQPAQEDQRKQSQDQEPAQANQGAQAQAQAQDPAQQSQE
ncbi:hypothetical protein BV22DRAFT_1052784, partial [Leucogyrophana mollusca]